VSNLDVALVTGGFTLGGVLITFAGTLFVHWRQGIRDQRAARARVVAEVVASADELLDGVRLFRIIRGSTTWLRWFSGGVKASTLRTAAMEAGVSLSLSEKIFLGIAEVVLAMGPGGVADEMRDKDASYFQSLVVPARQRLTTGVAPLRVGQDRRLARAADSLAQAGAQLADGASSLPRRFKRLERTFDRNLREFQQAAGRSD
jgi:hypothetical protein